MSIGLTAINAALVTQATSGLAKLGFAKKNAAIVLYLTYKYSNYGN